MCEQGLRDHACQHLLWFQFDKQAILTLLAPGQLQRPQMIRICCNQLWCAGVHFIIDVNYFPSYKEFPDAAKALSDVLKKVFHTQRSQQQL